MVVDDGIDPSLPALKAKLAGAYTIVCDGAQTSPEDGNEAGDFESLKRAMLAELATPDESCHLQVGIDAKAAFGGSIEDQRDRWNRTLWNDDDPLVDELRPVRDLMSQYFAHGHFHGTSTAATASFAVPELRLVLVEQAILTMEEAKAELMCLEQDAIDRLVMVLSDAEVHDAYLAHPLPAVDWELAALRTAAGVGLVNESFSFPARFALEEMLRSLGCPRVELHAYFKVLHDLSWAFDRAHAEPGVLFVRSAGNGESALNDDDDGLQCRPGDPQQVLVGAYGAAGARSTFTNFGDCVDVYAPGEYVVAPLPGDWLTLLSGTSFSAPLTLRHILFSAPQPFHPESARAALLAERQPGGNLDVSLFRPEQLLDVQAVARKRGEVLTRALQVLEPAAPERGRVRVAAPAFRKVVGPLLWAQRAVARGAGR